jgi:hypothetical protein
MEMILRVTTCDKCGEPMKENERVLAMIEGCSRESDAELTFRGSLICHISSRWRLKWLVNRS